MRFTVFIFALFPFFCFAIEDFQIWETQVLSHALCKDLHFQWETQTRFQDELIHVYSQENLFWRISPDWGFGANYRNSWTKRGGRWHPRRHPMFDFFYFTSCDKVQISFRSRFFMNLDLKDYTWRGRALFEVPLKGPLFLVAGDELFLRNFSDFFENRLLANIEWRLSRGVAASVGYIWRIRRQEITNILAFRLGLTF